MARCVKKSPQVKTLLVDRKITVCAVARIAGILTEENSEDLLDRHDPERREARREKRRPARRTESRIERGLHRNEVHSYPCPHLVTDPGRK